MPLEMLKYSPFSDFLIPGLVLLIVNGLGSIAGSASSFRLFHYAAEIALALGAFLVAWIIIQVYWIHVFHWLHAMYLSLRKYNIIHSIKAGRHTKSRHFTVVSLFFWYMSNMKQNKKIKYYSPIEEKINIISHAIGLVLSVIGLFLLVRHSTLNGSGLHVASFSIYGISLIVLYAASTFYHTARNQKLRTRLRVFDHASIYILIAGTYTPFALITLNGELGWVIFGLAWGIASMGVILKIFFTGKFKIISTLIYIFMGWMIVFFINPLINSLSGNGLIWLFAGGISYTIGAIIYGIKKIKFNHAIFHVFVLVGSFTHFISVFFHVLP